MVRITKGRRLEHLAEDNEVLRQMIRILLRNDGRRLVTDDEGMYNEFWECRWCGMSDKFPHDVLCPVPGALLLVHAYDEEAKDG